jgi:hypothetical protein
LYFSDAGWSFVGRRNDHTFRWCSPAHRWTRFSKQREQIRSRKESTGHDPTAKTTLRTGSGEEVARAGVLARDVLCVLLARTVLHPLDLRRDAVLAGRLRHQRAAGGVEHAHRVVIVAADADQVLVVVAERQPAHPAREEAVADGV